jgi:hypothetical protein
MAAFDLALSCVRDGSDDLLQPDRVNQLALAQNHLFRNTPLTPGNTQRLFVQQVTHGNVACSAVRHLANDDFSDSAWCQARARLPIQSRRGQKPAQQLSRIPKISKFRRCPSLRCVISVDAGAAHQIRSKSW